MRGIVILELVIDEQGKVAAANVVRSVPPFDEAALAAVRQWEYEVTKVDGQPVPVRLTVPITFALKLPDGDRARPACPSCGRARRPGSPRAEGPAKVVADVTLMPDGTVAEACAGRIAVGGGAAAGAAHLALRAPPEGPCRFKAKADFLSAAAASRRAWTWSSRTRGAARRGTARMPPPCGLARVPRSTAGAASAGPPRPPLPGALPVPAPRSAPPAAPPRHPRLHPLRAVTRSSPRQRPRPTAPPTAGARRGRRSR